jgi:hypothetical protein
VDLAVGGVLAWRTAEEFGPPDGQYFMLIAGFWSIPTWFLGSAGYGIYHTVDCNRFYNALAKEEAAQTPNAPGESFDSPVFKSLESLESTCMLGDQTACADLGMRYYLGKGITRNQVRANALFKKACDGGVAHACYNLANSYEEGEGVEKDLEQARLFYQRACEAGDQEACSVDISAPEAP